VVGHRRPIDLIPERLRIFRRQDWEQSSDTNHFDAVHRWIHARAQWVAKHPHSLALGDAAERLRAELQTQMSQYRPDASSWKEYQR
jgi:hypothetical protein